MVARRAAARRRPVEDTALVAYLLNPAKTNYRLEEVAGELLGEGPGLAPPGSRARWIWELWAMAPRALREVGLLELYEDIERPLVPVLADMERDGIRVDKQRLDEFSRELELALERATREIYVLAGGEFNIGSPKQLATILFEKLKLPPLRKTKTGYSTDADVLEQLALGHELPAKIIEHRTLAKLKSTYADSLPTLINARTGRIHTVVQPARRGDGPAVVEQSERCRTSRSAPSWAGASARRSWRSRGSASSPPTTRRSSCASSRTSRARRAWSKPSGAARTSTGARRPRCSASPLDARDAPAARRREDHELRGHLRRHRLRAVARARHDAEAGAGATSTSSSRAIRR